MKKTIALAILATACSSHPPAEGDAGITCTAPEVACGAGCSDLHSDSAHCGDCANSCPANQGCAGGQCYPQQCGTVTCPTSQVCLSGACVDRACFGVMCPSGQACARGMCLAHNCDSQTCGALEVCYMGACTDTACVGVLCPAGISCRSGICAADTCGDNARNGYETDVDCGGPVCPGCGSGELCALASDCSSRKCDGGICLAPTCSDGVLNGREGDVDCGGDCAPCAVGQKCTTPDQCATLSCVMKACAAPACTDNAHNGQETDVDCGANCPGCADGKACLGNGDCLSGQCAANECISAACRDGAQDGGETDVDCGGPCQPCGSGLKCLVPADCIAHVCTNNRCAPPSCMDGTKNGTETDRDCGGSCMPCGTGKGCKLAADCIDRVCGVDGGCSAPSCADHTLNGSETDKDCGGAACPRCVTGQICRVPADCLGDACDGGRCGTVPLFGGYPPTLFPGGAAPSDMLVIDLDKDGLTDLAISNSGSFDITLYYGTDDGGFVSKGALQVSGGSYNGPEGITAGDFNGDGQLDLATAAGDYRGCCGAVDCKATVIPGAGMRNFFPAVDTIATTWSCARPAAGRIDGDLYDDLVIGARSGPFAPPQPGIWLFPGSATGLQAGIPTAPGGAQVLLSDLNRDGYLDVLARDTSDSNAHMRMGTGSTFIDGGVTVTFGAGDGDWAAGDLNNDTFPDLVAPSNSSGRVGVALGLGDGRFYAANGYPVTNPFGVAIGDVDNDGIPDLVIGTTSVAVLRGLGDGTFKPAEYYGAPYGGGVVFRLALRDLNKDGKLDVLALTASGVWVVLNSGE